jgi:hypothetical protein
VNLFLKFVEHLCPCRVLYYDHNSQPNQAMTPYPPFPKLPPTALHAPAKPGLSRDVLWGRPLFKAPALPSPRIENSLHPFSPPHLARRLARAG